MEIAGIKMELGELTEIPRHTHEGIEIFMLLKGSVQMDLDGTLYNMTADDIIACNDKQIHGAKGDERNILLRLGIEPEFMLKEAGEADVRLVCNSCTEAAISQAVEYEQLRRLLKRLMLIYFQQQSRRGLELKGTLLELLSLFLEHFTDPEYKPESATYDTRIQAVVQQIKSHYRDEVSLGHIAEEQHMSVQYLSRLFKKETGSSFTDYLNDVRLASAVNELLHSDDSVMRVALNNGFSNVASFNRLFQKVYKETPAKYRSSRNVAGREKTYELKNVFPKSASLVKYLRQFDTKYQITPGEKLGISFDATAPSRSRLKLPDKIICVGQAIQLLKADIRSQIKQLLRGRKVPYMHFACVFDDGMYPYEGAVYSGYEYMNIFDFLRSCELTPFIQLRVDSALGSDDNLAANVNRLTDFFKMIYDRYSEQFLNKWRFEISYPPYSDPEQLWECYSAYVGVIQLFFPRADICLQFRYEQYNFPLAATTFAGFLTKCAQSMYMPSAITFYIADNPDHHQLDNVDYSRYRHIASRQINTLHTFLKSSGLPPTGVILMEWNTLSGFTTAESNAYYRSALFIDEIINLPSYTQGLAFWLNTYIHEAATRHEAFDVVSLFLFKDLKRPVYFAMRLMDDMHREVVARNENIVVTRSPHGDLAILVMNPRYFDPQLASDLSFTQGERRVFELHMTNISGHKLIERHHMDNKQTAIYDRWANMGFPSIINENVMEQLNRVTNMGYTVYEEKLTGQFSLNVPLDFNEAAIILIRDKF